MPESGSVTFSDEVHFSDSFTGVPVQHLAFQNVTFGGFVAIKSAQDIHFSNTHFADMSQWTCATEVSIQNSEIGPFTTDYGDGIDLYGKAYNSCNLTPGNWLIETSTIHGVSTNVSIAHPDAIALDDGVNVVIRRNRFWNNCGDDLRMATAGPPTKVVIQNNFFGAPVSCAAGAATTAQIVGVGTVVSYNTFDGWVQTVTSEYLSFAANQLWEGNIITETVQGVSGNCPPGAGTIVRYNVWNTNNSSSCGPNNISAANFGGWFVNPSIAAGDYHLTAAAAVALGAGNPSSYPAVDIDGQPRSGKPDAGASQFSAGTPPVSAPNPPTGLTSSVR
jgi:hypothetical protein